MSRLIVVALAALSLAACATTPTVYQPAAGPKAVGYSEYRIEPGRYRITFRGGSGAPAQQVFDYALLRAADIAIEQGYDWFRVYDRFTESSGYDSGPHVGVGVGGSNYGHSSSVGVGVGTSFNLGPGPAVSATIEVVMGKGPRPEGMDVYDARGLRENLGAPKA
jgi:hypothetical protein